MTEKTLYRVQRVYGRIALLTYRVIRETPCRYRLGYLRGIFPSDDREVFLPPKLREHWMVKGAYSPWARRTPEEAIYSFLRRKENYITILKGRLAGAKEDIRLAKAELARRGWKPDL